MTYKEYLKQLEEEKQRQPAQVPSRGGTWKRKNDERLKGLLGLSDEEFAQRELDEQENPQPQNYNERFQQIYKKLFGN